MLWIVTFVWLVLIFASKFVCKRFNEYKHRKILVNEQKRRKREFKALYKAA